MLSQTTSRVVLLAALAVASLFWSGGQALAQYGVSPSQGGMFFEDLRARSAARSEELEGERIGEGVYSYDQDGFIESEEGSAVAEGARDIGIPLNSAGYTIYSKRSAGDYTHFASPYPSSSTFFAPTYTSDAFLGGKRNLKLGPVNLGFGLSSVLEYNDNITRASQDEIDDFIWGTYLNVSANWPVTATSSLSVSTALGFDHYFNHPEVSPYGGDFVLNVLPGSTIAFDGIIGPVYVVVYDRVSVRPATQNDFSINSNDVFGVFQNDIGLGATWFINSALRFSANYMHSTSRVLNDTLENGQGVQYSGGLFDRDMDSIMTSLAWSPAGTWSAGVEGNLTWVHYPEGFNNDGVIGSAGVFFSTPIGKSTAIRVAAGFQQMEFDDPPETAYDPVQEIRDILKQQEKLEDAEEALAGEIATAQGSADPAVAAQANALANTRNGLQTRINNLTSQLAEARAAGQLDVVASLETQISELGSELNSLPTETYASAPAVASATTTLVGSTQQKLINDGTFTTNSRDTSDLSDFYYNVTLSNRLTSRISQALTFGHESALNTTSNYITADFISYGIGIIAWKGSRLAISGYYEHAEESGGLEEITIEEGELVGAVSAREDIDQHGIDVYWTHQLTSRLRLGLGYHYGVVDSSRGSRDYVQHAYNIDLNYALSRKMTVGLGYRYFTTDADDDAFDFDQSRAILAFNYNF